MYHTTLTLSFDHLDNPENAMEILTGAFANILKEHLEIQGDVVNNYKLTETIPDKTK